VLRVSSGAHPCLLDLQDAGQAQSEEILVELARLLQVAAAVGVVVQLADHDRHPVDGFISELSSCFIKYLKPFRSLKLGGVDDPDVPRDDYLSRSP